MRRDLMDVALTRLRQPLLSELVRRRREYGIRTHGTTLDYPNGRSYVADWLQEIVDAFAGYAEGAELELAERGAPPDVAGLPLRIRGLAAPLVERLLQWAESAGCGDLLAQQPPPAGGHEAPDVARRELAAARARIAELEAASVATLIADLEETVAAAERRGGTVTLDGAILPRATAARLALALVRAQQAQRARSPQPQPPTLQSVP